MIKSLKSIKSSLNHDFTKVLWKLCIRPINCPASKQMSDQYEITWEFKCPTEDLTKLDFKLDNIHQLHADKEESLTNLTVDTNFMIKSKTINCNYDELKETLGYEPDAVEFDAYLKKLLKQFQHQILKDIKLPMAS